LAEDWGISCQLATEFKLLHIVTGFGLPQYLDMISVLIVDPQPLFSDALAVALGMQSDLTVVDTRPRKGQEVVDAVIKLSPDVALLDYWMEGMDGPAATRLILSKAPDQKIILLCWFHGAREIREGVDAGAAAVLSKDVEVPNLAEAIRQVHLGHPLLGGEEAMGTGRRERGGKEQRWEILLTLTPRELEILSVLAASGRPEDVAVRLSVSLGTVRNHIRNILAKTGARSHLEAVILVRRHGLI